MNAAAAWQEWSAVPHGPMWDLDPEDWPEAAFMAGYRRALEDAAKKWQDPEFRRKQPVLAYIGLDIAIGDLAADREMFDREVARKGAEAFGDRAAAVAPRETKD